MSQDELKSSGNVYSVRLGLCRLHVDRRFIVFCVILLGTAIRFTHLLLIRPNLPFRCGGLFVEFARQIVAQGYQLPQYIPFYTDGGIPFAYPPLPFYVEAVLIDVLSLPEFLIANLLPPVIAALTLPSFYVLVQTCELTGRARLVALVAYATMPAAFIAQIEGGGLAEAFGGLALIWLAISLVRACKRDNVGSYWLAGLAWAFAIISSPGSAYASVPTVLLFVIARLVRVKGRPGFRTIGLLTSTGLTALAISSPYWLTVMVNHGVRIFVESAGAQHGGLFKMLKEALGRLVAFGVSGGRFSFLWDVTILGGILWALFHHRWALLIWSAMLFGIPREGVWMVAIPAALLAGVGGAELLFPVLRDLSGACLPRPAQSLLLSGILVLVGLYALLNPLVAIRDLTRDAVSTLSPDAIAALKWARDNTPEGSRFVVLASPNVKEWAPQIARRTVLNMPFGAEWEPAENRRIEELEGLLSSCSNFDCILASVTETMGYDDVYVYVSRNRLAELTSVCGGRAYFEPVWQNNAVAIGKLWTR